VRLDIRQKQANLLQLRKANIVCKQCTKGLLFVEELSVHMHQRIVNAVFSGENVETLVGCSLRRKRSGLKRYLCQPEQLANQNGSCDHLLASPDRANL
jgi:hypothetical protein